jgi:hypothetical protein
VGSNPTLSSRKLKVSVSHKFYINYPAFFISSLLLTAPSIHAGRPDQLRTKNSDRISRALLQQRRRTSEQHEIFSSDISRPHRTHTFPRGSLSPHCSKIMAASFAVLFFLALFKPQATLAQDTDCFDCLSSGNDNCLCTESDITGLCAMWAAEGDTKLLFRMSSCCIWSKRNRP